MANREELTMNNIKWKYDNKTKIHKYVVKITYKNLGDLFNASFKIKLDEKTGFYYLYRENFRRGYRMIGWFKKLSSAKQVANLLRNG